MWIWPPILIGLIVVYMVSYVLLRTSGDGRSALQRLVHPNLGGLQEEYGGDGHGGTFAPDEVRPEQVERRESSDAEA